ncbi:MAG: hypothetical protein MK106_07950 [Mariniblastus sp.]|nr:hypothetical protein [Mariniblastus sp.]
MLPIIVTCIIAAAILGAVFILLFGGAVDGSLGSSSQWDLHHSIWSRGSASSSGLLRQ